ncbi:MAG: NTP transferase domain-containing protein [Proteobacteria bacterium]|nr:NTP transferase domain-containing protein [Pseudomonadota bacterium]
MKISAVVLAAGQSTRIGMNKLLLDLGGETVLERVVDALLASRVDRVIVVVGYEGERVRQRLRGRDVFVIHNPEYHEGMAASIREGLKHIDPGSHGVLIALGDQPLMSSGTIDQIVDAYRNTRKGIVCPTHRGKRGHPVIFNLKKYEKALLMLRGDIGGKKIIETHGDDLLEIAVDSPGVVSDIDLWEDYEKVKGLVAEEPKIEKG